MARKNASSKKGSARGRPGEFRFRIEAFTPATMPMARLSEYLRELAEILGEPKDVHLIAIETGSTVPVVQVEYESIPKVQARADAVRSGDGPRDSLAAYQRVNRMLREDNGRAVFQRGKRGAKILEFPGRDEAEETFASVKQFGSIDGIVVRVGGTGDSIPVLLESEGNQIAGCHTSRETAKELAKCLFEPVRVAGMGYWMRDAEGQWVLKHFRIQDFEHLENLPLGDALNRLRADAAGLDNDVYQDLTVLRHGRVADGGA
jgi:hypothetical protein